jgi:transcriptional regulator with GAF, ATPase, and Fis domain
MLKPDNVRHNLNNLKMRLEQVNSAWTVNDHEAILKFYVNIVPKIMGAERCSIFIVAPGSGKIWLKFGTGVKEKDITPPRKGTVVGNVISSGKWITQNEINSQSDYHKEVASKTGFTTRNLICAPIKSLTGQGITGAVQVLNKQKGKHFSKDDGVLLQEVANYLAMAIENILLNQEISQISKQLNQEIEQICKEDFSFVAESRVMQNILDTVRVVSATPVNVLIHGESGSGKELVARMIHKSSARKDKPLVTVNCASVPDNLVESEFFGYEKGAFTGAVSSRKGRFEEADKGILFLDEIGDMPLVMQPKFLRAIQEGEGCRLGSNQSIHYDLRIISATNKDLRKEVAEGHFREDLFYRIFSVEIYIPPLRERHEDIIPLANFFLNNVSRKFKKKINGFSPEVLHCFAEYHWPGNVRQLLHEVERLVALTPEGQPLSLAHCSQELTGRKYPCSILDFKNHPEFTLPLRVKELEIGCIQEALVTTEGNKLRASKLLGITRQGLNKKIKRYNIQRKESVIRKNPFTGSDSLLDI